MDASSDRPAFASLVWKAEVVRAASAGRPAALKAQRDKDEAIQLEEEVLYFRNP